MYPNIRCSRFILLGFDSRGGGGLIGPATPCWINCPNHPFPALSLPESTLPRQPADVKPAAGGGGRERRQQLVSPPIARFGSRSNSKVDPQGGGPGKAFLVAVAAPQLCLSRFSFQLTVEMFDYLECELNLFLSGKPSRPPTPAVPPAVFV